MDIAADSDRGFNMDDISIFGENFLGFVAEFFDVDFVDEFALLNFVEDLIDAFGFIVHSNFK